MGVLNKKAKTQYIVNDLITNRWSPRAFKDEAIPDESLFTLLEAASWAASSMNEQPWRFIYARKGEEAFGKIASALMDGNKWATEAPVLIATVIKKTFVRNGKPNSSAKHDLGLAIGNLSIQATDLGIGLHQMGGFTPNLISEQFELTDDFEPITIIALGYFGNPENLSDQLKERELAERTRKSLSEIAFHGTFNNQ